MSLKRKKSKKRNLTMILASILFCLTLVTTFLTVGLYARYVTRQNLNDGARVIKFDKISIVDKNRQLIITPGVPCARDVEVSFGGSESVTYIFVEINASSHWSVVNSGDNFIAEDGLISFAIDTSNWEYLTTDDGKYVYYYVGENTRNGVLAPNNKLTSVDIIVDGSILVSEELTMDHFENLVGLELGFGATAVQANGFENVEAAWASIAAKGL